MTLRTFFLAAALLLSSCVSPVAIKTLKDGMSVNKGHMDDTDLPQKAREIATDNYDFMAQVLYNLDGTEVPADTAERKAARAPAAPPAGAAPAAPEGN